MSHQTATVHRKDGAWLIRCWCGLHSGWQGLLSLAVAAQIDHAKDAEPMPEVVPIDTIEARVRRLRELWEVA